LIVSRSPIARCLDEQRHALLLRGAEGVEFARHPVNLAEGLVWKN
jgi:hypothetical protein